MMKLDNIEQFFLNVDEFKNKFPASIGSEFSLNQIIQEAIAQLNTQCQGLYIGKLGELVNRVLNEKGEEMLKEIDGTSQSDGLSLTLRIVDTLACRREGLLATIGLTGR